MGMAGAQQHQARLTLTLLVFLLQGMALRAGLRCFQCPLCRDRDTFLGELFSMGIRIPDRWVSFSQLFRCEGTRAESAQGLPEQARSFAGPMGVGFTFMEKVEMGFGWKSRDGLGQSYSGDTEF